MGRKPRKQTNKRPTGLGRKTQNKQITNAPLDWEEKPKTSKQTSRWSWRKNPKQVNKRPAEVGGKTQNKQTNKRPAGVGGKTQTKQTDVPLDWEEEPKTNKETNTQTNAPLELEEKPKTS